MYRHPILTFDNLVLCFKLFEESLIKEIVAVTLPYLCLYFYAKCVPVDKGPSVDVVHGN